MKFFDYKNNRLVFIEKKASSKYWDKHWKKQKLEYSSRVNSWDMIVRFTKKYLEKNSKILEGGCGLGQNVWKLNKSGFKTVGVDYARDTINLVKKNYSKMNIVLGDVTKLPFKKNEFDGYWSLGVIEHFYGGYNSILEEMVRVIKQGGYLFVTFPHMSLLRRIKTSIGMYPLWHDKKEDIKNFYQFALDEKKVINDLEKIGFKIIKKYPFDGSKGLKDEVAVLKPILQKIYDSKFLFVRLLNLFISILFAKLTSHSILLICKKT